MGENLALRLWPHFLRLLSTVAGVLVLKHEVYDAQEAEIVVIALGLWLIGVPPALWLDAFRRAGKALESIEGEVSDPPEGGDHKGDVPGG